MRAGWFGTARRNVRVTRNPKHIMIAVAVLTAVLFIALLHSRTRRDRMPGDDPEDSELADETPVRARSAHSARIIGISPSRPSVPSKTRITRIARAAQYEDYDAQKIRAFGDASIYGIVRGESRKALPGVQIQLFEDDPMTKNPPLREAVTDQDGSYTLEQLNDAGIHFIIVAKAPGFAPEIDRVTLRGRTEKDFRLFPGVELSGVVRDAVTSLPIANATVYFPAGSERVWGLLGSVQTGPVGQFTFPAVRGGALKTMAEHEGYCRTTKIIRSPTKEAEIAMKPGGAVIRGIAVDRRTDQPVPGARIIARCGDFQASAKTADDGTFELTDLPSGKYVIRGIRGMSSEPLKIDLGDREVREDVRIVLPSLLFVSGRVIHAYENTPLPGVRIWFENPSGRNSVMSDENGQFAFETMVVSSYTMSVHEKRFLPVQEKKTTQALETITRKVMKSAASDDVTIRLKPVPAIVGTVRRLVRNKLSDPVFDAEVCVAYVMKTGYETKLTRTDPVGEFFVNLPAKGRGYTKVIAQKKGYVDVQAASLPMKKRFRMVMKPNRMVGELDLIDKTPLSGVKIGFSYMFPDNQPADKALRLSAGDVLANASGRFLMPLGAHQIMEMMFYLPDGQNIAKIYRSDQLLDHMHFFIYDPVSRDILSDVRNTKSQSTSQKKARRQNGNTKNRNNGSKSTGRSSSTPRTSSATGGTGKQSK